MDIFSNVDKVGIEMEGGWAPSNPYRYDLKGDCSVRINNREDEDEDGENGYYDEDDNWIPDAPRAANIYYKEGELVSPPISKWADLKNFMVNGYPDKVNESCGMHVHVSVHNPGAYQALATERFYNFMKVSLRSWGRKNNIPSTHHFWDRLKGYNHYCDDVFRPEEQIFDTTKSGARYSIINYCFSYHGTLEVRVLPMFDEMEIGLSAVKRVLWTVNRFLNLPKAYHNDDEHIEQVIEMDIDHEMLRKFVEI